MTLLKISWTNEAWEDYIYWQKTEKKILKRINQLIKDIMRNPFEGIGKPEPLKYELEGFWSRRINKEDRLVYSVRNDTLIIIQCRYHY